MKEPKRLLSHGASDFERQLLRAVASERPSALLRSRMQRSLGLVGPLSWASNVKAMFNGLSSRVGSRARLGAAAVGVVVAGGVAAYQFIPVESTETTSLATSLATVPEDAPRERVTAEPEVAPEAGPARVSESPSPAPAPKVSPSNVPVAADDSEDGRLREEIALLDGVKAALQRGEREQARQSLDTYRERFPEGILRREANVLRRRTEAKPGPNGDGTNDSGD